MSRRNGKDNRYDKRSLPLDLTPLEQRWATFFDLLNVRWLFNPVVPKLERPLPFWLAFDPKAQSYYQRGLPQERGLWVAVSPTAPNKGTCQRYHKLARASGHWVHLLVGEPQPGFQVWSWRLSECINIDARHAVADLELSWMLEPFTGRAPPSAAFDTDFTLNTIDLIAVRPALQRAFQIIEALGP